MSHPVRLHRAAVRAAVLVALLTPPGAQAAQSARPGPDPAKAEIGLQGEFQDWIVGCDNTRTCRAIGLPAESAAEGTALILDRGGEPAARPVIRLVLPKPEAGARPLDGTLQLAADGAPLPPLAIGSGLQVEDPDAETWRARIRDAAAEGALLRALRTAKVLTVARAGEPPFATLSLAGAAAALLLVDERQQRIGTAGALVRPGDRPDAEVPAPPPLPRPPAARPVTTLSAKTALPAPVRRLYEADLKADQCSREGTGALERVVARLAPGLVLYALPCWQGAYQGSRAYYLHHTGSGRAEPLVLPRPQKRGRMEASPVVPRHILGGDEVDPARGEISEFAKGRGIADCGTAASWLWTGRDFALTAYSDLPVCRGLDHDDWLTLHRTVPPG